MTEPVGSVWTRLPLFGNLGLPIALKEVRSVIRRNRFFWVQFIYLIVLSAGVLIIISTSLGDSTEQQEISQQVSRFFFVVQMFLVLLVFPAFASVAISSERVEKSFDLLMASGLTPAEIIWGKFIGIFGNCCYYLVVTLPVLGVCLLFGDAPIFDSIIGYMGLALLAGIVTMYGLMVSAWASNNIRAVLLTYAPVMIAAALALVFVVEKQHNTVRFYSAVVDHWRTTLGWLTGSAFFFCFCFVCAVQLLTSEEGNRASPIRILVLCLVLCILLLGFVSASELRVPDAATGKLPPPAEIEAFVSGLAHLVFAILAIALICIAATRVETPLRIVQQAAARPLWRILAWLFLPGGLRAVAYAVVLIATTLVALWVLGGLFSDALDGFVAKQLEPYTDRTILGLTWTLYAVATVMYCALAFLVAALGVRGALNIVIVGGLLVLANLFPTVQSQSADDNGESFLKPLSVHLTIAGSDFNLARGTPHVAAIRDSTALHGALTALLLLAGAVIMRIHRLPIIGYGHDARLGRSRRRVAEASGPP